MLSVSQRRFCGSACELAGHRLSTCASQHACCNACWRHIRLSKCLIGEFVFVVMQVSVEPLFRIGGGYTACQHVCWRLPPFTITAIARITNIQQRFVFDQVLPNCHTTPLYQAYHTSIRLFATKAAANTAKPSDGPTNTHKTPSGRPLATSK